MNVTAIISEEGSIERDISKLISFFDDINFQKSSAKRKDQYVVVVFSHTTYLAGFS